MTTWADRFNEKNPPIMAPGPWLHWPARFVLPPDNFRSFLCDAKGFQFVMARLYAHGVRDAECYINPRNVIEFDGGGSCRIGEERVGVSIDGVFYCAMLTQFPGALEALKSQKPDPKDERFIRMGGFMGGYCLSVETWKRLVVEFEFLWPEVDAKCKRAEAELAQGLRSAGVANLRPLQPELPSVVVGPGAGGPHGL